MGSEVTTTLVGAAFGAALTASGVFLPSVIVSQLRFEKWDMIEIFLTATASSAYVNSLEPRPEENPHH